MGFKRDHFLAWCRQLTIGHLCVQRGLYTHFFTESMWKINKMWNEVVCGAQSRLLQGRYYNLILDKLCSYQKIMDHAILCRAGFPSKEWQNNDNSHYRSFLSSGGRENQVATARLERDLKIMHFLQPVKVFCCHGKVF